MWLFTLIKMNVMNMEAKQMNADSYVQGYQHQYTMNTAIDSAHTVYDL